MSAFKPLLAHTVDSIETVQFPVMASPKLDGIRCLIVNGEAEADMSLQADEYAAWLWGNVYGYRIEDETGEEVESCYGFYVFGELDPIKSGIADAICESLNWEIKKSTEAKADAFVMEMELARPNLAPAYL